MTFALSYTYGFRDYLESLRAKRAGQGLRGRVLRYLALNVIFFGSVIGFTLADGAEIASIFDVESLPTLGAIVAGITLFGVALDWAFERWLPWFIYRQLAIRDKPLRVDLGEAISWSCNGLSGTMEWSSINRLVETPHGLFLFISKAEALLLPRRAVNEAEFAELSRLARAKVGRG